MRYYGSENVHVTFQNPASSKSKSEADFNLAIIDAYEKYGFNLSFEMQSLGFMCFPCKGREGVNVDKCKLNGWQRGGSLYNCGHINRHHIRIHCYADIDSHNDDNIIIIWCHI